MKASVSRKLAAGESVQEYEILAELGSGAFGTTYLARDSALDIKVALKEYLPEGIAARAESGQVICDNTAMEQVFADGRERFILEARIAAKFNHPNIVNILRYFRESSTAYIAMRYEPGNDLGSLLKMPGFVPVAQKTLVSIMRDVLQGLCVLHDNGCVHRDIKPSNIYIREDDSAMLLDFGGAQQTGISGLSQLIVVTPRFTSIEQYLAEPATRVSDLYALGATLYRCITDTQLPRSIMRHEAIQRRERDPLAALVSLAPSGFDEEFLGLIDHMLGLYPYQRPQSADEVLDRLDGLSRLTYERADTPPIRETITLFSDDRTAVARCMNTIRVVSDELHADDYSAANEDTIDLHRTPAPNRPPSTAPPSWDDLSGIEFAVENITAGYWSGQLQVRPSNVATPDAALPSSGSGALIWIIETFDTRAKILLKNCLEKIQNSTNQKASLLLAVNSAEMEERVKDVITDQNRSGQTNVPVLMTLDVQEREDVLCFLKSALAIREARMLSS